MRTQAVIDTIIAQAKIILSARVQLLAKLQQTLNMPDQFAEEQYEEFFTVELVLYALGFQDFFSRVNQNYLVDWLVQYGYYFHNDSLHFTEVIFNDQTFDTV